MNVLMTGATGMIGGLVLKHCLEDDRVAGVTSLMRRPSGIRHQKLTEIVVDDFLEVEALIAPLKPVDAVYYCQGVYTGKVDRDLFYRITVDYPEALARAVQQTGANPRFCLLSGAGADRSETSRTAFAKDKGIIENRLSQMGFRSFHAFRPGYIYPVTPRQEPNFVYRLSRWLYPLIRRMGDGASIRSTELAEAIFRVGIEGHDQEILENSDIIRVVRDGAGAHG